MEDVAAAESMCGRRGRHSMLLGRRASHLPYSLKTQCGHVPRWSTPPSAHIDCVSKFFGQDDLRG